MPTHGLGSVPNIPSSPRTSSSQPQEPEDVSEIRPSEDGGELPSEIPEGDGEAASDVRARRLAQIKAAIEAGEYETPEKLEAALDRLFEQIDRDEEDE